MTHFLCSWIYIINLEKVCVGQQTPLMKAEEGKRPDESHNKQSFTSTGHQEEVPKYLGLPPNHNIQLWSCPSACDNFSKPLLVRTTKHTLSENHFPGHQSPLSSFIHSVSPGVMGKRRKNNQTMFVLRRFRVTLSWVITV